MTRAAAALALLALAAAACGGDGRTPYALAPGTPVSLEVEVREEVTQGGMRRLTLWLEGSAAAGGVVDTELWFAAHTIQVDGDPAARVADTRKVAVSGTESTTPDPAVQRVLERMCGHPLRLVLDPKGGLRALTGFDAALADAAPQEGPAESSARSALSGLATDASLLRDLRAAGIDALPEGTGGAESLDRRVETFVPGRGVTTVRLTGASGKEHDGSPVVRAEGRVKDGATFTGEPGEPPMRVREPDVKVAAETMYDQVTRLPMQGNATVVLPYDRGPAVTMRVTFHLTTGK